MVSGARSPLLLLLVLSACPPAPASPPAARAQSQALWVATTGQPLVARSNAVAFGLPDGGVLVAGGRSAAGLPLSSTERYDYAAQTWSADAPTNVAHQPAVGAVALDGTPVIIGGTGAASHTAERYVAGAWLTTGPLQSPRTGSAAVALADGRVMIAGPGSNAELLQVGNFWSPTGVMGQPHDGPTATLLADGTVLVLGGTGASLSERSDLSQTVWSTFPGIQRTGHTATLVPSGDVLVVGGIAGSVDGGPEALLFSSPSGLTSPVPGLQGARIGHTATTLTGGDVLIAGGQGPSGASAARYVTALNRFVNAGCLVQPRAFHVAAALPNGQVLLAGGIAPDGGTLASSERLDFTVGLLASGQRCARDCECGTGACVDGVCCDSACGGSCQACSAARGATADGTCTTLAASVVCRAADAGCDVEERCNGVATECPADQLRDAGVVCRAADGLCDLADTCTGASPLCPANAVADAGVVCRAAGAGSCDLAETCDGVVTSCPADRFIDAGVVCRGTDGPCDVPEICSGSSALCPTDLAAGSGLLCRPADGGCDLGESCDGLSHACPADGVAFPGTVCRQAVGPCDVTEVCLGAKTCPGDGFKDAGVLCQAKNGVCDLADLCDGASALCPARFVSAGVECRSPFGLCDLAESCTGADRDCPPQVLRPSGFQCRAAGGACDKGELCNGVDFDCPADGLSDAGTICRDAAGPCDEPERCDGVLPTCSVDRWFDAGVVCRPVVGACDVEEVCAGGTIECPVDVVRGVGFMCRTSAGGCDLAETCDGVAEQCPVDLKVGAGVECRGSAGACDVPEACDGTASSCPDDLRADSSVVCRPADGACDVAETCAGELSCPADRFVDAGTACGSGVCRDDQADCPLACTGDGDCASGAHCEKGQCAPLPKRYVGWSCGCSETSGMWLLGLPFLLRLVRRKKNVIQSGAAGGVEGRLVDQHQHRGDRTFDSAFGSAQCDVFLRTIARGSVALLLLLATPAFADSTELTTEADAPIISDFAVRLSGILLRDFLASQIGGEVGASVSLGRRFDVDAALSLGRNLGARLGVSLHMRDDDERFRPFIQLRGLVHPVPEGVAAGAGVLGGVLVRLGPGRIIGGVLFEAYAGPAGYPPVALFASLGYQLDVYRAVEREGLKPVAPAPVPDPLPIVEVTPAPLPPEPAPPPVDEPPSKPARVSTRISLRDVLTFDERRATVSGARHDAALMRTATLLERYPQVKKVEVSGHADDGDDATECQRLSERRALAVLESLVKLGVSRDRLSSKGYGDTRTLVPARGPARKRESNRRVDFLVLEQSGP